MTKMRIALTSTLRSRWIAPAGLLSMLVFIAGCSTSTPSNISLPSNVPEPVKTEQKVGSLKVEKLQWKGSKPGCTGECPQIDIDSISFPDNPKLTVLIDHVLTYMTGIDPDRPRPYQTLSEYTQYFWKTAQARDQTIFTAKVKDTVNDIIAVELQTGQYLTGAAHGIPATQYLNWQRGPGRVLALDEALLPNQHPAYVEALRRAHQSWLTRNDDALRDPAAYNRMWPFQESNNFALTNNGLVVKYDAYSIAPYSHGQPELIIPYAELNGILRPEFIPKAS